MSVGNRGSYSASTLTVRFTNDSDHQNLLQEPVREKDCPTAGKSGWPLLRPPFSVSFLGGVQH